MNPVASAELSAEAGLFELMWLLGGGLGIVILSYAISRALRGATHGVSIRLQLFFAMSFSALCTATLIGTWALKRIEARAAQIFVEQGVSTALFQEFFADFGLKTSLLFGVICLISAGCAWALGRLLAAPIERLAQFAKQTSEAQSSSQSQARQQLPEPSGREVRRLTKAFDEMLQALEDRQRFERFMADLSHDLKNPVAAIRASTEVLLSGAAEEPIARARFLARVDEASERLERLLSDFLSVARLEARGIKFDAQAWSLEELTRAALEAQAAVAEVKGVGLKLDSAVETQLIGSKRWVLRAIENLLANAVRHSPRAGLVRVTITASERQLSLEVEDEGPGVAEHLQGVLFERFVSHKGDSAGTGLGLAIVQRVAEAHAGEVKLLQSRAGGGARFLMSLPRAPRASRVESSSQHDH